MKWSSLIFSIAFVWAAAACSGAEPDTGAQSSDPSTTDTSDPTDSFDTSDASDAGDAADASASSDASDVSDASDSSDATDPTDGSDASEVADSSDPSDAVTTVDDIRNLDISGDVPRVSSALVDFVATNSDGSSRGPPNIAGSPTVLWFFPAAGTYG